MSTEALSLLLALIVYGEGAGTFSNTERVATGIAHVALNRAETGWWEYTDGWNGYDPSLEPPLWARRIGERVALGHTEDPSGGCLFVLSGQDVEQLGFPIGKAEWSVVRGPWELHFYKEWPTVPVGQPQSCASSGQTLPVAACPPPAYLPVGAGLYP